MYSRISSGVDMLLYVQGYTIYTITTSNVERIQYTYSQRRELNYAATILYSSQPPPFLFEQIFPNMVRRR